MPRYDLSDGALCAYRSRAQPPPDLDVFWRRTLADARDRRRPPTLTPAPTGLRLVSTFDVTFSGFRGDPVRAWYHRPADTHDDLPVVVRFQGYGDGRGEAHEVGPWVLAGYACLEVDTRGQGVGAGARGRGDTADPWPPGQGGADFVTRGILTPDTYYYRRVFTDAVLAAEAAAELPGVDPGGVVVAGKSQGGGISLAAAALAPAVAATIADVPFLSDFRRGAEIAPAPPYADLARFLAAHPDRIEQVFTTLAYFDVSILAPAARSPALFSVALMDEVCPPSTVYAAFNAYGGPKQIRRYPFSGHEGGHALQLAEQLRWLAGIVPVPAPLPAGH